MQNYIYESQTIEAIETLDLPTLQKLAEEKKIATSLPVHSALIKVMVNSQKNCVLEEGNVGSNDAIISAMQQIIYQSKNQMRGVSLVSLNASKMQE